MMKNLNFLAVFILLLVMNNSCKKEEVDKQKPVIDISFPGAFPRNCDTLYFGESFTFRVLFSDNAELGSYSIGIHNNFDHHSHSTEVTQCDFDPVKEPVNPFLFIQDYMIPAGLQEFETNQSISIPSTNTDGLFDEGDYHFFIQLTDKQGWSAQKGLSIKMYHR
jgi:hypothetical protein